MHPFVAFLLKRAVFFFSIAGLIVVSLFQVGTFDSEDETVARGSTQGCDTTLCCEDCRTIPVTRVIDGDTFVSVAARVRLYEVDTPEVGERCANEATLRLRQLAGTTVRIESGPRAQDAFNRLLYYIYTRSGESVDEILVRDGLGEAWRRDGQHRDALVGLEREAQAAGAGCLWQRKGSPSLVSQSQASSVKWGR